MARFQGFYDTMSMVVQLGVMPMPAASTTCRALAGS